MSTTASTIAPAGTTATASAPTVVFECAEGKTRSLAEDQCRLFSSMGKLKRNGEQQYVLNDIDIQAFDAVVLCADELAEAGGKVHGKEFEDFFAVFSAKNRPLLFEMILAAEKLGHTALLTILCQNVGEFLCSTNTIQARNELGIADDLGPDDRERIVRENEWCTEK